MTDPELSRFIAAEYRVRLFLSVDLSGSTAFKNSISGQSRHAGATPNWVTVFQKFYSDFPSLFAKEFQSQKQADMGSDTCPMLWKAVGDELVFCGRLTNKKSCIVALNAFIKSLHDYRKRLIEQGLELDVKGAGWLAAFPEPNRTVQLQVSDGNAEFLAASEALESSADRKPFEFDFLGKAIDTGFRIAAAAQPSKFVLSVQLARLLASHGANLNFGHNVRMERPALLKGVNNNEPYPIMYIDTMEHLRTKEAKKLEREVLKEDDAPSPEKISRYLEAYCGVVGTDEIKLKDDDNSTDVDAPESYKKHQSKISEHLEGEKSREYAGEINGDGTTDQDRGTLGADSLKPLAPKP